SQEPPCDLADSPRAGFVPYDTRTGGAGLVSPIAVARIGVSVDFSRIQRSECAVEVVRRTMETVQAPSRRGFNPALRSHSFSRGLSRTLSAEESVVPIRRCIAGVCDGGGAGYVMAAR